MRARQFSVFKLQEAVDFAEEVSKAGRNVYVGAALRRRGTNGRASDVDVITATHSWDDFDSFGDDARVDATLKEKNLQPGMIVKTGRTPHLRFQPYFRLAGSVARMECGAPTLR